MVARRLFALLILVALMVAARLIGRDDTALSLVTLVIAATFWVEYTVVARRNGWF